MGILKFDILILDILKNKSLCF